MQQLSSGPNVPHIVHVVVEIPAQSDPVKYEMDKASGLPFVDRFIGSGMRYPCNYGFIPGTLGEDNDPIDVLVLSPYPLLTSCVIQARPIGALNMSDEEGIDTKILTVPASHITPLYDGIKSPHDLSPVILEQIAFFFKHYKDLEAGRWVELKGWEGFDFASQKIIESIKRFADFKPTQVNT